MNKHNQQWFIAERTRALALTHLTRRQDLVVTKPARDVGPDYIVTISKAEEERALQQFGVILHGSKSPVTEEQLNQILHPTMRQSLQRLGRFPYPVCLLYFTMDDDQGYYTWVAEPKVVDIAPRLVMKEEANCRKLDRAALDWIVSQVERWYELRTVGRKLRRVTKAFQAYGAVHDLFDHHIRMQFEDVGAMLRLPIMELGITNGCNFAATAVLCNLISGISVTIYQPAQMTRPDKNGKQQEIGSGDAFKALLIDFFPSQPGASRTARKDRAEAIYKLFRNPFTHALALLQKKPFELAVNRLHQFGLSQEQVEEIEESVQRPTWLPYGVTGMGNRWEVCVDGFYRDALDMLGALAQDSGQMKKAENRFKAGQFIWHQKG